MKQLAIILVALSCLSISSAQKKPFTIADLYKLTTVDGPQYSPDGSRIAFTTTTADLTSGKSNSDIWIMNADGTGLHQMTRNAGSDTHPRWSPDGKSILFLSNRKNGEQAWLLPADGGEPTQITDLSYGVSAPEWLADGHRFVFTASVFPECGADDAANKKIEESMTNGPLQAHMADALLYRHWTSWNDGHRTHILAYDIPARGVIDLTPGDYDAPSFSLGGGGFAVSPDGTELCYVSDHEKDAAGSTNKDLWVVPTTGGTAVNITAANRGSDTDPVYSPDGRSIAYKTQATYGFESDLFRLAIFDREKKERKLAAANFDNWINEVVWSPDGKSIYFTGDVKGKVPLYRVDLKSDDVSLVLERNSISSFCISPNGKDVACVHHGVGEPREIWRVPISGKNPARLTTFNKSIEDAVDIRPVEEVYIPSPTGRKIQMYIVKPHNFDPAKKYPVILNVHGGPQSQWSDGFRGDWQVYPGAGYIVAFPNPHGSTGFGQEFTSAISKDWNGKVFQDVMAVTDSLEKMPFVDPSRIGAMGWSYGGYMMMWLEGHTTRYKAIVSMMGVYDLTAMYGTTEELWFPEWDLNGQPWNSDLYQRLSPNNSVKNFKTPCLVITGERDYRVSYNQSLEFYTGLQRMNVPSRLIVFKNDGHWPSGVKSMPFYYNAHLDWFHRYLGGDPAPYDMTRMLRNQAYESHAAH